MDLYKILGLDKSATKEEIKKTYRKLAMKFHPDRNPGNSVAEEKFKELSQAAEVLLDDEKRKHYDTYGTMDSSQGFGHDFSDLGDIFGDLFGDIFGNSRGRRSKRQKGKDIHKEINLTLEEVFSGTSKTISVNVAEECSHCSGTGAKSKDSIKTCSDCNGSGKTQRTQGFFNISKECETCHGSGRIITEKCDHCINGFVSKMKDIKVDIPAGVSTGQILKLSGKGEPIDNGESGDLLLEINIKDHDLFVRSEDNPANIITKLNISFAQAVFGTTITLPTLSGNVEINIPKGIQSGTKMKLKNKGLPILNDNRSGHLYIKIQLKTPTELSQEEIDIFNQLKEIENNKKHSFFERVKSIF